MAKKKATTTETVRFRPLGDRVVLQRDAKPEKTAGGLYMPAIALEPPTEATVLAVGPGVLMPNGRRSQMTVEVGDRVFIGKYSGTDLTVHGLEVVILREEDITGVIEEE